MMSSWQVSEDKWGSDHFPIVIKIDSAPSFTERVDYRYDLKRIDWRTLFCILESKREIFSSIKYLNAETTSRYNTFVENLDYCINESSPSTRKKEIEIRENHPKINQNKCIWWNNKCEKITHIRKASFKSVRHRIDLKKFIEYKRVEASNKKDSEGGEESIF